MRKHGLIKITSFSGRIGSMHCLKNYLRWIIGFSLSTLVFPLVFASQAYSAPRWLEPRRNPQVFAHDRRPSSYSYDHRFDQLQLKRLAHRLDAEANEFSERLADGFYRFSPSSKLRKAGRHLAEHASELHRRADERNLRYDQARNLLDRLVDDQRYIQRRLIKGDRLTYGAGHNWNEVTSLISSLLRTIGGREAFFSEDDREDERSHYWSNSWRQ